MRKAWERLVQRMGERQWRWAMLVAVISDIISFGLEGLLGLFSLGVSDLVQIPVDLLTAALIVVLLGFRWTLAIPLVAEAIPGLAIFPTWTLAVAAYAATDAEAPAGAAPNELPKA
jgi:hypothetical protein